MSSSSKRPLGEALGHPSAASSTFRAESSLFTKSSNSIKIIDNEAEAQARFSRMRIETLGGWQRDERLGMCGGAGRSDGWPFKCRGYALYEHEAQASESPNPFTHLRFVLIRTTGGWAKMPEPSAKTSCWDILPSHPPVSGS